MTRPLLTGALRHAILPLHVGHVLPPVLAVAGYFDDSREGGIFALAGYVGLVDVWDERFAPAWEAVIAAAPRPISEFKASDCRQGFGEFAGWSKPERDKLTADLVSLIIDEQKFPGIAGFGAAVVVPFAPLNREAMWERFAYFLCMGTLMSHAAHLCSEFTAGDSIHLIFDEQKGQEGKAHDLFREIKAILRGQGLLACDVLGPSFRDSAKLAPLQAADLLAHETFKEMKNRAEHPPRATSVALRRLVEGRAHYAHYYDAEIILQIQKANKAGTLADFAFPIVYEKRSVPRTTT